MLKKEMEKTRKEKYKDYRLKIERSSFPKEANEPTLPQIEEEEDIKGLKKTLLLSVDDILKGTKELEDEEAKKKKLTKRNKKDIIRSVIFFVLLIILIVLAIITGIKAFS